ncbi:MAG: hypothetical protein U0Z44_05855 [Kouleothrix sp.]
MTQPRIVLFGCLAALALVCAVLALVGPLRISITLARDERSAAAAPELDITATAPPATPVPTSTAVPPTSTSMPPTAEPPTAVPPTATALPPAKTRIPATAVPPPPPSPTAAPDQPNVVIAKTADRASAQAGDTVVFTLTARNTGAAAARDVVVTDVVPAAFEVIDLASSQGDVVVKGQTVTAYPAVLAPGASVTIRVTVKVRAGAAAGPQRNTALITTSTPGDDPGDNTSTIEITVASPREQQTLPNLPRTADPDAPTFLMIWGPWLIAGLVALGFGVLLRFGLLRPRFVAVSLAGRGLPPRVPALPEPARPALLELDAPALVTRWRAGASIAQLAGEVAATNPGADAVLVSLAVQQLIDTAIGRK